MGLVVAALLVAATVSRADSTGTDPVLVGNIGHGSPPCVVNGVSYQATTDSSGDLNATNGNCENTPPASPITQFSADALPSTAPGGITPELGSLLAPFAPGGAFAGIAALFPSLDLQALDWTTNAIDGQCPTINGVITCIYTISSEATNLLSTVLGDCSWLFTSQECSDLNNAIAGLNGVTDPNLCSDPLVAVFIGIIQGCDISLATTATGGSFTPDSAIDIVQAGATPAPLPEPSTLALLLIGLGGLPLLRRRFARADLGRLA